MPDVRIVSLLPSATEIICALGLEPQLVGVTHECDYPPVVRDLPKVTHTLIPTDASSLDIDRLVRERLQSARALYTLDLPTLEALRPDVIVTQALCDVCAVAEEEVKAAACVLPGTPRVVNLEPQSLAEVFASLHQVAEAVGCQSVASQVVARLEARVAAVAERAAGVPYRPRVALLEWLHPPFSCGHWSPELVALAGGEEVLGRAGVPSRTLSWEEVVAAQPEVVFVACCGFSVERTLADLDQLADHPAWQALPAVRQGRVYVTDGSHYFSRPGPRLVESLEILAHALQPASQPQPVVGPAVVYVPQQQRTAANA
ncbi:cobalamin-binding protein [Chloracidobacterium validum]|uniref:Cobalamin-binding protein n=1 Tax=Chloracidobacterium validum TaxID=2821543 RepID=A0ABX8BBR5_9BACT|nr:cobalamin-binding protein [Chloracidobacterium validum]QUW04373.1 cobalamin-binding protein [Chloracidobacterium validum]